MSINESPDGKYTMICHFMGNSMKRNISVFNNVDLKALLQALQEKGDENLIYLQNEKGNREYFSWRTPLLIEIFPKDMGRSNE